MAANDSPLSVSYVRVDAPGNTEGLSMPKVLLSERRAAGNRQLSWVFQRHLECVLYNRSLDSGSSGAVWKLLNSIGMGSTALQVDAKAVSEGHVLQTELDQLMRLYRSVSSNLDSMGRIRSLTVIPLSTAAAVARTFGRSPASIAFLRAFSMPVPESWELQEQQDANHDAGEVDLVLEEQLEEHTFEAEDQSFAQELTSMAAFASTPADDAKLRNVQLSPVPTNLARQLDSFLAHRTSVFAARRQGAAVVDSSCESDKASLLRFFGWLKTTDRVPEGGELSLDLLGHEELGDLAQAYVQWLRDEHELRYSSIANYLNGLVSVTTYVYSNLDPPEETLSMDPTPLTMLINLRAQAEKASRQESMFDKRVGGWLEWDDVQKCRIKAVNAAAEHIGDHSTRRTLLREATAISLLSLIPPDRVGLIRKLRLGHTLKRTEEGGWRLDLTRQRDGHKTSRFYGPFAAKLPDELTPVLNDYAAVLELAEVDGETSYLFHPPTCSSDRPMESSAWTAWVKRLFTKLHGAPIAPKTLRSVFITWLRDNTDCPEVLKSAAHAMKHRVETQASGRYDADADTRLVKAAYDFNLTFAAKFGGGGGAAGSSSDAAIEVPAAAQRWITVKKKLLAKLAAKQPQGGDPSRRTFVLKVPCDLCEEDILAPGGTIRFPVVPGAASMPTFRLPDPIPAVANNLVFNLHLSKGVAKGKSVAINGYQVLDQGQLDGAVETAETGSVAATESAGDEHDRVQPEEKKRARKSDGKGKKAAKKVAKEHPSAEPESQPDFALDGYSVQPPPTTSTIKILKGELVAHRFSTTDWEPGWAVGTVKKLSTAKRTLGQFEVDYGKTFNPRVYFHKLLEADYGPDKTWCRVHRAEE